MRISLLPVEHAHLRELPGLRPRQLKRWKDADLAGLSDERFYIPTASHSALFDAFFIDRPATGSPFAKNVLWILRTTISTSHDGPARGFEVVAELAKKVGADMGGAVEVRYLLVVPCKDVSMYEVKWNMAKEVLRVAPGVVFFQFLRT